MNLEKNTNLPDNILEKTINPFSKIASSDAALVHEKFETLRLNCEYYTSPLACGSGNTSSNLNILHLNARSILSDTKFEDFHLFINCSKVKWHLICISESWLTDDMVPLRQLEGYTGYFKNRKGNTGGGVTIYVCNKHIKQSSEIIINTNHIETLFVKCEVSPSICIIIGQVYKPPSLESSVFINELTSCLEMLDQKNKTTFLCGDFNTDLFALLTDNTCQEFFNTLASFGYLPTITKTTRFSENKLSLIDNIFTNNLDFVTRSGIIYSDSSDHFPIFVSCAPQPAPQKPSCYKVFDKSKFEELLSYITANLHNFTNVTDPEEACNILINAFQNGIEKYSIQIKNNRKATALKPWISPAILTSINRRHCLFIEKNKNPTEQNKSLYSMYRNRLNDILREAKQKYFLNQLEENRANCKRLWQILNGIIKGSPKNHLLPESFVNSNNENTCDKDEIADSFNTFFISVGKNLQSRIPPSDLDPLQYITSPPGPTFSKMDKTNSDELHEIVNDMKNVGAGIDQINASIFKRAFPTIINEIVHFINICLDNGVFPDALKLAIVKPIFKSGEKSIFGNYRPISILPYISKVLEKIIHRRTMTYLHDAAILNDNQFGFQKSKSTYMPLLLLQENITKSLEDGHFTCGIYLDLKKAFDTVDHSILMRKLEKYGFAGSSLHIMQSFLTNRHQCVEYNGTRSSLKPINIGVPQGSVLGPLLFLIYINDFPNISKNMKFLLFADDTVIFLKSDTIQELQHIIDKETVYICNWLRMNKLTLNTQKTLYQLYSNRNNSVDLKIKLNGAEIKQVETVKYLGVYVDSSLKWSAHLNHLSLTLSRNIGVINRVKHFLNKQSLLLLYNALLLPYINYCCLVWGFTYPTYLNKIEILQKRAVRIIDSQHRLAHTDPIFCSLGVLKVKDIAKQQLLSVMLRKFIGTLPPELDKLFTLIPSSPNIITRSRRHFEETFSEKLYRTRVASWVGPRIWNDLISPHFALEDLETLSKGHIKKHTKEKFLNLYNSI